MRIGCRTLVAIFLGAFVLALAPGILQLAAQPSRLIVGTFANPNHFYPYDFNVVNYPYFNQFYNVLVRLDGAQKPQPELASSWSVSPDGLIVTMNLRHGVKFHSGREFVADDVKRTLARVTDKDTFANAKPLFQTVKEVRTPDRYTAQLVFESPNPGLFDLLDQLFIIDDQQWDKHRTQPIGTGPFVLAQYLPGEKLILRPFKDYWRKPGPRLDEIEFRIIGDPQALVLNVESGTIDAMGNLPVREATRLEQRGLAVDVASEGLLYNIMFNTKEGRFTDVRLRQAFTHAVNRARFIRLVLGGKSRPMCLPWIPTSFAYDAELDATCDFNLDKAKKLVVEAGFPNGFETTIVSSTQVYYGMTKLAEILQEDLKKIGVTVKIDDVETAEYSKRHNNFGFEAIMSLTGRINRDPSTPLNTTVTFRAEQNAAGYVNPRFIELNREARSTLDLAKRKQAFREINQIIRRDLYTAPVASSPFLFVHHKKVKNLAYSVDGFVFLENVTIE